MAANNNNNNNGNINANANVNTPRNNATTNGFLAKTVNGFNTRNKFIRSLDIANVKTVDEALKNYAETWFSRKRKQYLNEAFKQVSEGSKLFWTKRALVDMIREISVEIITNGRSDPDFDEHAYKQEVDILESLITLWSDNRAQNAATDEQVGAAIRSFEAKHKYSCPDTFKTCWMNHGAYVTLCYGIKYDNLRFPGHATANECLDVLKGLALSILGEMDHYVDTRLFELCYYVYKAYFNKIIASKAPQQAPVTNNGAAGNTPANGTSAGNTPANGTSTGNTPPTTNP